MSTRLLLPNSRDVVRAVLLDTVQSRRNDLDSALPLPSVRTLARALNYPGSARVIVIREVDTAQLTSSDLVGL